MNQRLATPIPERMRKLERDPRGYPIPYIVFRDADNKPHFTINDTLRVRRVLRDDLCAICGEKLLRGRWFVGGPASAFHEHGAYIDPPLHKECAEYALRTCPYLAAPSYAGRIDAGTVDPAKIPATLVFLDTTMDPERPHTFVAVMATGQKVLPNGYIRPKRPYVAIQYWRLGERVENLDGWRRDVLTRRAERGPGD